MMSLSPSNAWLLSHAAIAITFLFRSSSNRLPRSTDAAASPSGNITGKVFSVVINMVSNMLKIPIQSSNSFHFTEFIRYGVRPEAVGCGLSKKISKTVMPAAILTSFRLDYQTA